MKLTSDDLFYTTGELDRQAHLRTDTGWLEETLHKPDTRFLILHQDRNLFTHINDVYRPALLTGEAITNWWQKNPPWAYLGHAKGKDYFVLDLSLFPESQILTPLGTQFVFEDLRRAGPIAEREQAARCAYARGLMFWHKRHQFCGHCGYPSHMEQAGHVRRCSNIDCALEHFPRTDPAVIMLVHDKEKCLLATHQRIKTGMYSTLAGFVEPGETLEQAVKREVMEETGIQVGAVEYAGSQPWPFPTSLMLGFYATAESYDIHIDLNELSDAQWFTREDLRAFPQSGKLLPSRDSIARNMIEAWLKSA